MAKGSVAKQNVIQKVAEAFGSDYIGESGGKYYVWADDGGERVQISLALVCPKTFIDAPVAKANVSFSNEMNFDFTDTFVPPTPSVEITEEEKKNLEELMKRLGL